MSNSLAMLRIPTIWMARKDLSMAATGIYPKSIQRRAMNHHDPYISWTAKLREPLSLTVSLVFSANQLHQKNSIVPSQISVSPASNIVNIVIHRRKKKDQERKLLSREARPDLICAGIDMGKPGVRFISAASLQRGLFYF
jgi:hypothetical protein